MSLKFYKFLYKFFFIFFIFLININIFCFSNENFIENLNENNYFFNKKISDKFINNTNFFNVNNFFSDEFNLIENYLNLLNFYNNLIIFNYVSTFFNVNKILINFIFGNVGHNNYFKNFILKDNFLELFFF